FSLFFLCLLSTLSYGQTAKGLKKNGMISTVKYFLQVKKEMADSDILDQLNIDTLTTNIGNKSFPFRIAYNQIDPEKKTILAHIGLDGEIDAPHVLYLIKHAQRYLSDYNFVVVDTLSSSSMITKNC